MWSAARAAGDAEVIEAELVGERADVVDPSTTRRPRRRSDLP
jgi:hypothetical protein